MHSYLLRLALRMRQPKYKTPFMHFSIQLSHLGQTFTNLNLISFSLDQESIFLPPKNIASISLSTL